MKELIIDSFAGGGGASLGIQWATGQQADIAINHDDNAIKMHEANHPETYHVREDVWKANLVELTQGRPVGLLWTSPDCRHFSRAKGSQPIKKSVRSLAWTVVKWAEQIAPRVIVLENVREFCDWGPVVPQCECRSCGWKGTEGQATLVRVRRRCPRCSDLRLKETGSLVPDPARKGLTFKRFVGRLRNLGYEVQWRNMDAADYGAPTHRRRLFLIARCDGEPIVWPEPTHAEPSKCDDMPLFGSMKPYRTAAECIDWSIPCPSIFERERPLVEKTMRRIAHGIKRYVIDAAKPYIVQVGYGERDGQTPRTMDVDSPLGSAVSTGKHAIVTPILSKYHGAKTDSDARCKELSEPFATLDTQPRFALVAPTLVPITRTGDRACANPTKPVPTVTASKGGEYALASAVLVRHFGKSAGADVQGPAPTTVSGGGGKTAIVAAFIAKHFGGVVGAPIEKPLPTTTTIGTQNQLVSATLVHMNHGDKQWSGVDEPARTVTSGNHAALVYAFLVKYFGTALGADLNEPAPTATTKDRFGLVTVRIDGEEFVIVDIGMRMLTPRELARAQGFPEDYILTGSKTSQVARIGNSVCPVMAKVLVEANYSKSRKGKRCRFKGKRAKVSV